MGELRIGAEVKAIFNQITAEYGESAYTLASALTRVFADAQINTPDRLLVDRQIATSLAMLVDGGILSLDVSQIFPTFIYTNKKNQVVRLFNVVNYEVSSIPHCFKYTLTRESGEDPPIIRPDTLVALINKVASISHIGYRKLTSTDMPIIDGYSGESDYWAEEDLMFHLMSATINALHIMRHEDIE